MRTPMGVRLAASPSCCRSGCPRPQFTVQEIVEQRLTQDAGLVLEGSFPGTARTYPKRRLHVRILLNEEEARGHGRGRSHDQLPPARQPGSAGGRCAGPSRAC